MLAAGLMAIAAGPAFAVDTLDFDNPTAPNFADDVGEGGTLTVTAAPTSITFTNSTAGDTIDSLDNDCSGDGTTSVTCTPANVGSTTFNFWFADMDDGDDTVTVNGSLGGSVFGGDGNDQINSRNVGPRFPSGTFTTGVDGINDPNAPVSDFVTGSQDSDVLVTGNGNDRVEGDSDGLLFSASGPEGDGFPLSEYGVDQISTGPGNDSASGDFGNGDRVDLGEGDDFLNTFAQDGTGDIYEGGPGLDGIGFESTSEDFTPSGADGSSGGDGSTGRPFDDFNIDLATGVANHTNNTPESDTATNFEDAFTDSGNDTIVGNTSGNLIESWFGTDAVNPGAGADVVALDPESFFFLAVSGGADGNGPTPTVGNDTADIADGFGDRLTCGGGADAVQADQFDVDPNQDGNRADSGVSADCETVSVVERRAGGADVIAPDCTLTKVKKSLTRKRLFRGFRVRVLCNEAADLIVQMIAQYKSSLFSKAGDVILAEKRAKVAGGAAGSVKVKPLKKFRKRLRKGGFRVRVQVQARDQYGNLSVERKTAKVKKPRRKKR